MKPPEWTPLGVFALLTLGILGVMVLLAAWAAVAGLGE